MGWEWGQEQGQGRGWRWGWGWGWGQGQMLRRPDPAPHRVFPPLAEMQDPTRRGRCIRDLVFSLPPAHHDTMKVLFHHLCR